MRTLLDTNILLRSIQSSSSHHTTARQAVAALLASGRSLCIASQTVYEFLAVATRPLSDNGLGMPHGLADSQLEILLAGLEVLYDSQAVALELRRLVTAYQVVEKRSMMLGSPPASEWQASANF